MKRLTESSIGRALWLLRARESSARLVVQTETPISEETVNALIKSGYALRVRQQALILEYPRDAVLYFYLEANAVRRGKIVRPAIEREERLSWLEERLKGAGTKLIDVEVLRSHTCDVVPKDYKLYTVTYHGLICVKNPKEASRSLRKGIGRSKHLGCGLLLTKAVDLGV